MCPSAIDRLQKIQSLANRNVRTHPWRSPREGSRAGPFHRAGILPATLRSLQRNFVRFVVDLKQLHFRSLLGG